MMTSIDSLHVPRTTESAGVAMASTIPAGNVALEADLMLPRDARGLVLFAHDGGSSHRSPRHQLVARALRQRGLGTLLFDALTSSERRLDAVDERLRFDVGLLARRLGLVTDWVHRQPFAQSLPIGYFGASQGAAAAIVAAAERPQVVRALVCRGGRPDLAARALRRLRAPTLLLVGGEDVGSQELDELALAQMTGLARLEVVAGAGHLFEEPGALEAVAQLAGGWFVERLLGLGAPEATRTA